MAALLVMLPVPEAMVLHGATQLASNGFRAVLLWRRCRFGLLAPYAGGALAVAVALAWIGWTPDEATALVLLGALPLVLSARSRPLPLGARGIESPPAAAACGLTITTAQVAAGAWHTCAVDASGRTYCWGWNGNGQLGSGSGTVGSAQLDILQVADVAVTWESLRAGRANTCATTAGSDIYCWGWNGYGQLGTGDYAEYSSPTEISSSQFWAQVASGRYHTCALNLSGEAYCWGNNESGQIGDGGFASYPTTPTAVVGGFTYDWIAAGGWNNSCAVSAGAAKCWGGNWNGQFGDGTTDSWAEPVDAWLGVSVADLVYFQDVGCAIDFSGNVWCTGYHGGGNTGLGVLSYEPIPVRVGGSGSN